MEDGRNLYYIKDYNHNFKGISLNSNINIVNDYSSINTDEECVNKESKKEEKSRLDNEIKNINIDAITCKEFTDIYKELFIIFIEEYLENNYSYSLIDEKELYKALDIICNKWNNLESKSDYIKEENKEKIIYYNRIREYKSFGYCNKIDN